jgi:Lar family restriction alleviation protein
MSQFIKPDKGNRITTGHLSYTLKPCPFCGSNNLSIQVDDNYIPILVTCDDCNAEGPQDYGNKKGDQFIELWNQRK